MHVRVRIAFLALLLLAPQAGAKNKKKQVLPDVVLKAQTVAVVIRPDAGEPLKNPLANRTAQGQPAPSKLTAHYTPVSPICNEWGARD